MIAAIASMKQSTALDYITANKSIIELATSMITPNRDIIAAIASIKQGTALDYITANKSIIELATDVVTPNRDIIAAIASLKQATALDYITADKAIVDAVFTFSSYARRQLTVSAGLLGSLDVAEILRAETPALLEDAAAWASTNEEAAARGDRRSIEALLLFKYLCDCFLLLVRQLNPSARSVERYAPAVARLVFLTIVFGALHDADPQAFEKINNVLASPIGLVGLYLAVNPQSVGKRPVCVKHGKNRLSSKPGKKALRRKRRK
jgi:hypothetical protein